MPHVILEYSKDLEKTHDIQELVETVVSGAIDSGLFTPSAIKGRAHSVDYYWTGGSKAPFVCVEVKLLPGRTLEMKQDVTKRIFDKLVHKLPENIAISVEINDLNGDAYQKRA